MVEVFDISGFKKDKHEREKLEEQLVRESFVGRKIQSFEGLSISVFEEKQKVAYKMFGERSMEIYDEHVLEEAKRFGRRFEQEFHLDGNFTIKTDYSKK